MADQEIDSTPEDVELTPAEGSVTLDEEVEEEFSDFRKEAIEFTGGSDSSCSTEGSIMI